MRVSPRGKIVVAACGLVLAAACAWAQQPEAIDWQRARELFRRNQAGEKLSEADRAYLDRAIQARRQGQAPRGQMPKGATPAAPPKDLKPLSDMTASDKYKGEDGGLYGGGSNTPPEGHLQAALAAAKSIAPLDAQGKPAADGKIGFISIGMSNTTQEFSTFVQMAQTDKSRDRHVAIVDGAQGGMDSQAWALGVKGGRGEEARPWERLAQRLRSADVSDAQVQVAWVKQARIAPGNIGEYPVHADALRKDLVSIIQQLKQTFPNLKIVYLSSRIYGGYARGSLNPEPYAYESALAVRSLIQDQIKGSAELNYDPAKGAVKAPPVLWGPYLWADGAEGRKLDDLVWNQTDLGPDGTHPSDSGRRKVATLLLDFCHNDPTARIWYTGQSARAAARD